MSRLDAFLLLILVFMAQRCSIRVPYSLCLLFVQYSLTMSFCDWPLVFRQVQRCYSSEGDTCFTSIKYSMLFDFEPYQDLEKGVKAYFKNFPLISSFSCWFLSSLLLIYMFVDVIFFCFRIYSTKRERFDHYHSIQELNH